MNRLAAAVTAATLSLGAPALAQDTPPQLAIEEAQPSAAEIARQRDASIDRGFFNPHAETIAEGQATVNSYELFLLGVSYGVSNELQLSFTTLLPIVEDFPLLGLFQAKYALHRSDDLTVSARAGFNIITPQNAEGALGTIGVGLLVDYYLDQAGRFALHGGASVNALFGSISGDVDLADGLGITLELGVSAALGNSVKVLGELWLPAASTSEGFEVADVALLAYGVRFFGPTIAADLGLIKPVGDVDMDELPFGFPYVAFSARF